MASGNGKLLGSVLGSGRFSRRRILVAMSSLWLGLVCTEGLLSDSGVAASEGDGILQLPGPAQERSALSPAQVIGEIHNGSLQVQRGASEESGLVTVLTGFPCTNDDAACNLLRGGAFGAAATRLRDRIASGDDQMNVRCGLANALYLEGDLLGAARVYTWAANGDPHHPDVHNGMGNVFSELRMFKQATDEFQALSHEPGYAAVAYNNLGNAYRRMNRVDEAMVEYSRAIVEDPNLMAAHFNRAGALLVTGRYDEAAWAFREAAQRARDFGDAYLFEGLSHLKAGNSILSAAALYRAAETGIDSPALNLALGMALQDVGLDEEAAGYLGRAIEQDPAEPRSYQLLSVSMVRLGNLDRAAEILERGFDKGLQDADAHFFLGLKLFLCEKYATAARHFLQSAALGRRKPDTFFALGQALLQSGEVEPSIKALNLASRMSPEAPEIHFALGIALFQSGDGKTGIEEMRTAATLDPQDADTRVVLIDFQRRSKDFAGCAETARALVDINPELVATRFDAAYCLAFAGNLDLAAEAIEDAMDHDVEGTEVLDTWKTLVGQGRSADATAGAHLLLGLIEERRGNWSAAVRSYERFILVSPTKAWTRRVVAKIHELVPRAESAEPHPSVRAESAEPHPSVRAESAEPHPSVRAAADRSADPEAE